jgi:hypothetical protein
MIGHLFGAYRCQTQNIGVAALTWVTPREGEDVPHRFGQDLFSDGHLTAPERREMPENEHVGEFADGVDLGKPIDVAPSPPPYEGDLSRPALMDCRGGS